MNSRVSRSFAKNSLDPREVAKQFVELKEHEKHPFVCSCGRSSFQVYVYPGELDSKENQLFCRRCYSKLNTSSEVKDDQTRPYRKSARKTHSEMRREKRLTI